MTDPIIDPRPFADVLRDWKARHRLTYDTAALRFGVGRSTFAAWLAGDETPQPERIYRGWMLLADEGRA